MLTWSRTLLSFALEPKNTLVQNLKLTFIFFMFSNHTCSNAGIVTVTYMWEVIVSYTI